MKGRELLWERVNAALDAGRDPLDDAGVQESLEGEPELFNELDRLGARLDELSQSRSADRGKLWEHLDAVFDERRDPLDDPEVQRALARDPSGLDELVRLDARLRAVVATERAAVHRTTAVLPESSMRARRRFAAAAAALALVAAVAWLVRGRSAERNEPPAVAVTAIPVSRVLSHTSEVVVERPDGRTVISFDGTNTYRSSESYATTPVPADEVRFVAVVQLFSVQR